MNTGWRRKERSRNSFRSTRRPWAPRVQVFCEVGSCPLEGSVFISTHTLMVVGRSHRDGKWEHQGDTKHNEGTTSGSSPRKKNSKPFDNSEEFASFEPGEMLLVLLVTGGNDDLTDWRLVGLVHDELEDCLCLGAIAALRGVWIGLLSPRQWLSTMVVWQCSCFSPDRPINSKCHRNNNFYPGPFFLVSHHSPRSVFCLFKKVTKLNLTVSFFVTWI